MKQLLLLAALSVAISAAEGSFARAFAQTQSSDHGSATATVCAHLTVTKGNDLEFGDWDTHEGINTTNWVRIAPDGSGGAGTVTYAECTPHPHSETPTQATFTIVGDGLLAFNVTHEVTNVTGVPEGGVLTIMNSIGESVTGTGSDNSKGVSAGWTSPMYLGVGMYLTFPGHHGQTEVDATIDEVVAYD